MLSFFHKRASRLCRIIFSILGTNSTCRAYGDSVRGSHGRSPVSYLKSFSTLSPPTSSSSSTADFLRTSLGLSPEQALVAAQTIGREPKPKSDAVVALFRRYGFSSEQITQIFVKNPQVLWCDADKILGPKLQFLSENGFADEVLARVLSADPYVLNRSLEKHIAPSVRLLKSFFGCSDGVISLLLTKRGTWVLHQYSEAMEPNIEMLRSLGVPEKSIVKMLLIRPRALARDVDQFAELVNEARRIGFDTSSLMFIHGIATLSGMKKDKWVSKIEVFKSFGWTEEQVRAVVVKQPQVMDSAEERIKRSLDFFTNELKWGPNELCKYPNSLMLSFEKRILPRTVVLGHLVSKGLVDKKSIGGAYLLTDAKFMNKFVQCYLADIPQQLFDLYQNKVKAHVA
ncbi:Mitochodrial transcription termination factor [Parasponia andersonii]|uniref:Mitochodrial transcription termination factor n=1 Tax=Parasponia andersonii TaxID=3476 RepID=A0A2P5CF84_PARAD|nr:Mitochodrial transcription termination factor [Parasponia andersonii]